MKRLLSILALIAILTVSLTSCGLTVPRPEVKEGRFNLSVTYEINGKVDTLSAVYVCEFDGTSFTLEGGNFTRAWKDHVEGDYEGDDYSAIVGTTDDGGNVTVFFGVYPEYFMGDPEMGDRGIPEPSIYVNYPENEYGESTHVGDPFDVAALYGAKIISYEYDAPIKNSFSKFDFN